MKDLPVLPIENVKELFENDEAFKYSVENRDTNNMKMVLRAHGYNYSNDCAEYAIFFGENVKNIGRPVAVF